MKKTPLVCLLGILLAACNTTPSPDSPGLISRSEAPKSAPPPPMSRPKYEIKLDVVFAEKSSKLVPPDMVKLDELLTNAKASSFEAILIEGRSNESGTPEFRLAIADKRANAVKMYLVTRGLPHEKIQTIPTLDQTWKMPPECKGRAATKPKNPVCIFPGSPVSITLKSGS
jgi:hypothetical protein